MVIEGQIVDVMESYPLQLTVSANGIVYYVGLQEETTVARFGSYVDAGQLMPGALVTVRGERSSTSHTAMTAAHIELT